MTITISLGAVAALGLGLAFARRRLLFIPVRGRSMHPTYRDGDRLIATRRRPGQHVRRGQVVVYVAEPGAAAELGDSESLLIKRVVAVAGDPVPGSDILLQPGRIWLLGDGPNSLDSRRLGHLPEERVLGIVCVRLWGDPRRAANSGIPRALQ